MSDDDPIPEDQVHMEDCTCEHDPDDHGWARATSRAARAKGDGASDR